MASHLPPLSITATGNREESAISSGGGDGGAHGDASGAVAEWDRDMLIIQEVERLEKDIKFKLPDDLRDPFLQFLSSYPGLIRLPVYKMFETLEWDRDRLAEFYAVLTKVPGDLMSETVNLMESFVKFNLQHKIFVNLTDLQGVELIVHIERSDVHLYLQVIRHIPDPEIIALHELIGRLSSREIISMLKRCNEPMAKFCRLCKARRLHSLEQHMLTGQVPEGLIKVPGTLPFYDTAQVWSACDEKGFTYNPDTGDIFWHRTPVDLVQICEKCLLDVNQAISNNNRFEELFHIEASERKARIKAARVHEKGLAEVIWRISHERANRRCREWCLRNLEAQRFGLKAEADERDRIATEADRQRRLKQQREFKQQMVQEAMSVDQKWLQVDLNSELQRLDKRQNYTELKQRLDYSLPDCQRFGATHLNVQAPKQLLHPRTWQLQAVNDQGQPMLAEGAAEVYGTHVPPVVNHDNELRALKQEVDQRHGDYLEKQARLAAERKAARDHEIHMYNVLIREYFEQKELLDNLARIEAEKAEKQRLINRYEDRMQRRAKRFEDYLNHEREHMKFEDVRSYLFRDYEWQLLHEQQEREDMFNEEMDQTEVDRFWGFDNFIQQQNKEELELRQLYEEKTRYLNKQLVLMQSIQPFNPKFNYKKIGTLSEDILHADNETARRQAVIKKLKAEEVRGKLKVRPFPGYL